MINIKPTKKITKRLFGLLSIVSQFLLLFVSISDNYVKVQEIFWNNPYGYTVLAYFLSVLFIGLVSEPRKDDSPAGFKHIPQAKTPVFFTKSQSVLAIFVTAIFLFTLYSIYTKPIPPDQYIITPHEAHASLFPIYRSKPKAEIRFEHVDEFSSLKSKHEDGQLIVYPDPKILQMRSEMSGKRSDNIRRFDRVIKWLRSRAIELEKPSYLHILNDDLNLYDLTSDYSGIVSELMPTKKEYKSLSHLDKAIVNDWIIFYIGQWSPKFRFIIDNTSSNEGFNITHILFNAKEINHLKSGIGFTSESKDILEYNGFLPLKPEQRTYSLLSQGVEIDVAPNGQRYFDFVFTPPIKGPGMAEWIGELRAVQSTGDTIQIGKVNIKTINRFNNS